MTRRILPPEFLQRAVAIMHEGKSLEKTAVELGVGASLLRTNMVSSGLLEQFKNRYLQRGASAKANKIKKHNAGETNKYLMMKLRSSPNG